MTSTDIDSLYQKYCCWKQQIQRKDSEIQALKMQLKDAQSEKETAEKFNANSLEEIAGLNKVITGLRNMLAKNTDCENKMVNLCTEKKTLELKIEEQTQVHKRHMVDVQCQISSLIIDHEEELKKLKEEEDKQREEQLDIILEKLREKDEKIMKLEEQMCVQENEQKQEIILLKAEFEQKITQMQVQLHAATKPPAIRMSSKNEEILRKKYEHVQAINAQQKEEINALSREIQNLKKHNEHLSKLSLSNAKHSSSFNPDAFFKSAYRSPVKRSQAKTDSSFPFTESQLNSGSVTASCSVQSMNSKPFALKQPLAIIVDGSCNESVSNSQENEEPVPKVVTNKPKPRPSFKVKGPTKHPVVRKLFQDPETNENSMPCPKEPVKRKKLFNFAKDGVFNG